MAKVISITSVLILVACSGSGSASGHKDVYLRCSGHITSYGQSDTTLENQEIAAHISDGEISFSGNGLLLGQDIQICPSKTLGLPEDDIYFDSETCVGNERHDKKRKYGTYNKILKKLEFTNEIWENNTGFVEGTFKCVKIDPDR